MKSIYIILTQSGTNFSKILKMITKEKYNHASICLNSNFNEFYSFGRRQPNFILPGGFVIENAFTNVFGKFKFIPCLILEKEVTDEQYNKLKLIINSFIQNKDKLSYAIISLLLADTKFSMNKKNKYFCSQFVAKVLNDININTPKVPEHMHPYDFKKIDNVKIIYEGNLKTVCKIKIEPD